jgi:ribulose-bisphosphate carboxylase large chain
MDYVDTKYKPSENEVITEFSMAPDGVTFEAACNEIAAESSIGTWTEVSTMSPTIAKRLKPHVFWMDKKAGNFKIAYPIDLFERGNIPQLMSSIGGNVFGMRIVKTLRLEDVHFPEDYVRGFRGPAFGIEGVRTKLKVWNRPLLGTIIKPKVGLTPRQMAKVAYEAAAGGMDFIKDDENLTSLKFCTFEDRVPLILEAIDKAQQETGRLIGYSPNITGPAHIMEERAEYARKHDSKYVMIDIITVGWSGLQYIRDMNFGMMIHAHRAGHAMFTKPKEHGMSMLTVAKLARLAGVDQIHIGTAYVGKMSGSSVETREIEYDIEKRFVTGNGSEHILEQFWHKIKPVFAVASGGLHPGSVPALVGMMGKNIVIQAGGGVHGHRLGSRAGATAMRQSLDAVMQGVPLKEYADTHKELRIALYQWGTSGKGVKD